MSMAHYYMRMLELQEKLRKSEQQRLLLEEKFNSMLTMKRDAENEHLQCLRHKYHKFLEEHKKRQARNESILNTIDQIENRANCLAARSERLQLLRRQYDAYLHHKAPRRAEIQQPNIKRKLFGDNYGNQSAETKLRILEQYLRSDHFQNLFTDNRKTKENILRANRTSQTFDPAELKPDALYPNPEIIVSPPPEQYKLYENDEKIVDIITPTISAQCDNVAETDVEHYSACVDPKLFDEKSKCTNIQNTNIILNNHNEYNTCPTNENETDNAKNLKKEDDSVNLDNEKSLNENIYSESTSFEREININENETDKNDLIKYDTVDETTEDIFDVIQKDSQNINQDAANCEDISQVSRSIEKETENVSPGNESFKTSDETDQLHLVDTELKESGISPVFVEENESNEPIIEEAHFPNGHDNMNISKLEETDITSIDKFDTSEAQQSETNVPCDPNLVNQNEEFTTADQNNHPTHKYVEKSEYESQHNIEDNGDIVPEENYQIDGHVLDEGDQPQDCQIECVDDQQVQEYQTIEQQEYYEKLDCPTNEYENQDEVQYQKQSEFRQEEYQEGVEQEYANKVDYPEGYETEYQQEYQSYGNTNYDDGQGYAGQEQEYQGHEYKEDYNEQLNEPYDPQYQHPYEEQYSYEQTQNIELLQDQTPEVLEAPEGTEPISNTSGSNESAAIQSTFVKDESEPPILEKKLQNLGEMLETDTESIAQDTKMSNDSDFDFSNR